MSYPTLGLRPLYQRRLYRHRCRSTRGTQKSGSKRSVGLLARPEVLCRARLRQSVAVRWVMLRKTQPLCYPAVLVKKRETLGRENSSKKWARFFAQTAMAFLSKSGWAVTSRWSRHTWLGLTLPGVFMCRLASTLARIGSRRAAGGEASSAALNRLARAKDATYWQAWFWSGGERRRKRKSLARSATLRSAKPAAGRCWRYLNPALRAQYLVLDLIDKQTAATRFRREMNNDADCF